MGTALSQHPETVAELNPLEYAAWRTFLRAHAAVMRALEADLLANHDLSLASYDVLVQLAEAPEGRLRMSELAEAVLLSRSGLTRLVDRLERDGLVLRASCPSDARGTFAVLTDAGRRRLTDAAPGHLAAVRSCVTDRLEVSELGSLVTILSKLAGPEPARETVAAAQRCAQVAG